MKPVYYALVLLAAILTAIPAGSAEAFPGPLTRPLATLTPSLGLSASIDVSAAEAGVGAALAADGIVATVDLPAPAGPGRSGAGANAQVQAAQGAWVPGAAAFQAGEAVAGAGLLVLLWHLARGIGPASLCAMFSRISKKQILDHHVRDSIHDAISQRPGISLSEIQAMLGLGWGTAVHHVERLESARLVVSVRIRQFRRFYCNGSGLVAEDRQARAELTNDTTRSLALAVSQSPGAMQRDLCQAVGVRPSVANKHLGRLEQAQLLTRRRSEGTVQYFPTERLGALVAVASS